MIRINLLPREDQPAKARLAIPQLGALAPLALVLVVAAGVGGAWYYQTQQIKALQSMITAEEKETRQLAPEIAKIQRLNQQRKDLNDRLDVITRLDADRYFRVHLMDELNRSLPEHMWLTRFEDKGSDEYTVEGVTFSNFLVSDFLQNVTESPYFDSISLLVAEKGEIDKVRVVKFKAQAKAVRNAAPAPFEG